MAKYIPLTQGLFSIVDDEDYEYLSQWKWYANRNYYTYYAMRHTTNKTGKNTTICIHTQLLGKKDNLYVDHIDGDGLNNQRSNIRHVTPSQNNENRHRHTSKSNTPTIQIKLSEEVNRKLRNEAIQYGISAKEYCIKILTEHVNNK